MSLFSTKERRSETTLYKQSTKSQLRYTYTGKAPDNDSEFTHYRAQNQNDHKLNYYVSSILSTYHTTNPNAHCLLAKDVIASDYRSVYRVCRLTSTTRQALFGNMRTGNQSTFMSLIQHSTHHQHKYDHSPMRVAEIISSNQHGSNHLVTHRVGMPSSHTRAKPWPSIDKSYSPLECILWSWMADIGSFSSWAETRTLPWLGIEVYRTIALVALCLKNRA